MKRRNLIVAGIAGAFGAWWLRPSDRGANHQPYFKGLGQALDSAAQAKPTLVIDYQALQDNIATLLGHTQNRFAYRIVAKSLPSLPLLQTVMQASGSNRLMLFHQPFINQVAAKLPTADVLLGKPMPVTAARNFYRQFKGGEFQPERQLKWLLDTPQRARQYDALARELSSAMPVVIELDIGLHRGGVSTDEELLTMLDVISASPFLQFRGFMGYEPHVTKAPGNAENYRDKAMAEYRHYVDLARTTLADAWPDDVLLNAGGSPTYQMYNEGDYPFNELAAGSCLVMATDFDLPSLADHRPASYIATPVLKSLDTLRIPGVDVGKLQTMWDPNRAQTFFTYGGYWKARPESPAGLKYNGLMGRSTNQEMLNGSKSIDLRADDWVFLRPTQSEFVFLQFGDIAIYRDGKITEYWPVLGENLVDTA
ncbi:MAG: DSD1 family PLP-dependent enzyme [Halioglobus sp.]